MITEMWKTNLHHFFTKSVFPERAERMPINGDHGSHGCLQVIAAVVVTLSLNFLDAFRQYVQ